jgi:hypothetical protein
MEYHKNVLHQVQIIDSVLHNLGEESSILDNLMFNIDEMSWEEYLILKCNKKGFIKFKIYISKYDLRIDIDRVEEALHIDLSEPLKENIIKQYIEILYTCRIEVQYCGNNYTKLFFYNNEGVCCKTIKQIRGLYLKLFCKSKSYPPLGGMFINKE